MRLQEKPAGHFLKPGEMFYGDRATLVSTLLGSCVAVTMFSPRCRVGAICHALLPSRREEHSCPGRCDEGSRYVDCAIRMMLEWFGQRGVLLEEIEVNAYGGSDMLGVKGPESRSVPVGRQNLEQALHIIRNTGLQLNVSDLGGRLGRKIRFSTHTGEVQLDLLKRSLFRE